MDDQEQLDKMSYYLSTELNDESIKECMNFFNQFSNPNMEIDFYINSPGGFLPAYNTLKSLLERSQSNITLINSGEVSSYAFILFYTCKNVNKILLDNCTGLIHTISSSFEDRDLRNKADNWTIQKKNHIDQCNRDLFKILEDNKVLSAANMSRLEKGQDIIILYDDLKRIMNKCPYGNFIS